MTEFTPARLAELRGVAELLSGSTFAATLDDYSNVGRVAYYPLTDELMCSRMRVAAFFENLPETVLALIAALEAKTAEVEDLRAWKKRVIEQVRDTTTGQPSPPGTDYGELIDRLKRERDEALAEVSKIEGRAVEWSKRAEKAEAAIERVKAARSNHPECDKYDDDSPVVCGWKRTVQSIDAALEAGADDD